MLANISVPLLGLVDTAVIGHLPGPQYLAGVAVGSTIFGVLYMGFNFLRMGTTGLVATARGAGDHEAVAAWLGRALIAAVAIGLLMWLLQNPIGHMSFLIIRPEGEAAPLAESYFFVRIWAAPAALANFALLGWMIGLQKARQALVVQLILNCTNIVLDVVFVLVFHWGVAGAAAATVVAEMVALSAGLFVARHQLFALVAHTSWRELTAASQLRRMFALNSDILIRSLCLQAVFVTFTAAGARLGEVTLATNALLMQFQLFMAFALDGFSNAVEALAGEAMGARKKRVFMQAVTVSGMWALAFAMCFCIFYGLFWRTIVHALTDVAVVRESAANYVNWMIVLPLVSVWSFLLDGIFIGSTQTAPMRNTMIVSLLAFLGLQAGLIPHMGNHGLWLAFLIFMLLRGVTLGVAWPGLLRRF